MLGSSLPSEVAPGTCSARFCSDSCPAVCWRPPDASAVQLTRLRASPVFFCCQALGLVTVSCQVSALVSQPGAQKTNDSRQPTAPAENT